MSFYTDRQTERDFVGGGEGLKDQTEELGLVVGAFPVWERQCLSVF